MGTWRGRGREGGLSGEEKGTREGKGTLIRRRGG